MSNFITYLLQSASILAVLYSVYWLFLRKDTYFHVNRFYLVSSLMLAMLVPLVDIRLFAGQAVSPVIIMLDPVLITSEKIDKLASGHLSWFEIAAVIYFTGVIIFTLRLIIQLVQLAILVRRNKITHQDGAHLVFVDKGYSPFSFFNLIFIRREYYIDGKLTPVIAHEKIHIQQNHTIDLLLIEIVTIFQWFNPFAWFLGRSMKNIHEFLADEGVLSKGFQKNEYQTLILNEAMGLQVNNLTNNFNISLIKNRITMMTKTRSASWALIKVAFAFPALLAVLFLFTAGTVSSLSAQDTKQQYEKQAQETKATPLEQPSEEKPVFIKAEVTPEFPGGIEAMYKYMATNIKYPEEARKKGVQGRVFITFIIETDGSVSHIKILRGIGSGCDEEAVRVVSAMPKWSPGKEKGEAVRVQFNLPVMFSLKEKAVKTEEEEK
jgi:TonB family protein